MLEPTTERVVDWLRQEVKSTVHINRKDVQWPSVIPLGSEYIQHRELFFASRWVWKYTTSGWTSITEFMGEDCLSVRELSWTPAFIVKHADKLGPFRGAGHMWALWRGPFFKVHNSILTQDGQIVPKSVTVLSGDSYEGIPDTINIYPHRDILALWKTDIWAELWKLGKSVQNAVSRILSLIPNNNGRTEEGSPELVARTA
jgi:hypothetical protein